MSFSELHQKELEGMSNSVFGEEGIVERLRELRELVIYLGEQVPKMGTKDGNGDIKEKIRDSRVKANKLCDQIDSELRHLPTFKKGIFSSNLETTEEAERRQQIWHMTSEFAKMKDTLHHLFSTIKPLDVSPIREVFLDSQLSMSQLHEIEVDFEKDYLEILKDLEDLLRLFDQFRDIVSEQTELLNEVEKNAKGSLEEIHEGIDQFMPIHITPASRFGALGLPVLGGGLGLLVGGPVGAALGIKVGIMLSGAGLGLGAGLATGVGIGYWMKKKKETEEKEWEYIKRE